MRGSAGNPSAGPTARRRTSRLFHVDEVLALVEAQQVDDARRRRHEAQVRGRRLQVAKVDALFDVVAEHDAHRAPGARAVCGDDGDAIVGEQSGQAFEQFDRDSIDQGRVRQSGQ